jgi:multidrug transporter EmrE-like cation transporter
MQPFVQIAQKIPISVLLLLSGAGVVLGDTFAKYWSLNPSWSIFVAAMIGYLASGFFYIPSLLQEGLVITSVIWSLISIIGFLFVGLVVFKEHLTPIQRVGVSFGVVSMVVLAATMK